MVAAARAAQALAAVAGELGSSLEPDGWAPSVQGGVGHVLGARGADGSAYVLKLYARQRRDRLHETEVRALTLLGAAGTVPVPRVIAHGRIPGDDGASYLLMTRLPGVRWADRRRDLSRDDVLPLHRAVARLLRQVHTVVGEEFGSLVGTEASAPTAWERVRALREQRVQIHLESGGSTAVADRVWRWVEVRRELFEDQERRPVLCHNDFIDGNLLVRPAGEPTIVGVVDLERASWDDPMCDLARTWLHAGYHDPTGAEVLLDAYAEDDAARAELGPDDLRARLDVYAVLHSLDERSWITADRPPGWHASVARLDDLLEAFLANPP